MNEKDPIDSPLTDRAVALPESRQLDLLADMFSRRGAKVHRVPLVAILDTPNTTNIEAWLDEFTRQPPEYFVILTGEGIRRLSGFARRAGCLDQFVAALASTVKICRGPKPGRALKELGLQVDLSGAAPTTPGIIETLDTLELSGRRVAVQLYGEDPNLLLMDYLDSRGAIVLAVAPYVYAADSDTDRVLALLDGLRAGQIDVIAFTSKAQVDRLLRVAKAKHREAELLASLEKTLVAAVGPVVADQLRDLGIKVGVCPRESFFMKPMVREIERYLERRIVE